MDTFKLKLKYFNESFQKLLNSGIDFELIDSGSFLPSMLKDKMTVVEIAKRARLQESSQDKDVAFESWVQVSLLIDEFKATYFDDRKVIWAKKKSKRIFQKEVVVSLIIGLLTGIISSYLVYLGTLQH